jgi:hypothetical protein
VRAWGCRFQRGLICPSAEVGDEIGYGCLLVSLLFSGLLPVLALLSLGSMCNYTTLVQQSITKGTKQATT